MARLGDRIGTLCAASIIKANVRGVPSSLSERTKRWFA